MKLKIIHKIQQAGPIAILFSAVGLACVGFLVIEYAPSFTVFLVIFAVLLMSGEPK